MPDTEIEGLKNPTGKDVLYSTYANIGKTRRASVSAYVNWNATPRTRIYMNMSGDYSYMEAVRACVTTAGASLPTVVHSRRCPRLAHQSECLRTDAVDYAAR